MWLRVIKKVLFPDLQWGMAISTRGIASEMTMDTGNSPTIKDDYVMVDKAVVQVNELQKIRICKFGLKTLL